MGDRDWIWSFDHLDSQGDWVAWRSEEPRAKFVISLCNVKTDPKVYSHLRIWEVGENVPKIYYDLAAYEELRKICSYAEASHVVSKSLSKIKNYTLEKCLSIQKAIDSADELFLSL